MSVEKQRALTLSLTGNVLSGKSFASYLWVIPLALGFAAWELVTRAGLIPSSNLPTFSSVLAVFLISIQNYSFLLRIAHSFLNLVFGLLLAFAFALPLAFAAGSKKKFDLTLHP